MTAMRSEVPPAAATDEAPGVVASPERIDAWLAVARAGDRFVYATRPIALPAASRGAAHMRALSDRRLVQLNCPRDPGDRSLFRYMATRTPVPLPGAWPAARAPLRARSVTIDGEVDAVNALMAVLERFADAGRPCPTDVQLAERAGLHRDAIPATLAAMRSANLIRVYPVVAPTARRIHIVATGAITGFLTEARRCDTRRV